MEIVERSGKTVEDAINEALGVLDTTLDKVDVEIIEEGSKGFLGFGIKPARVKLTLKYDPEQEAYEFLKEVTVLMGLSVEVETNLNGRHLDVEITGENLGILIGKRGQTLDAIQYLTNLVINKDKSTYVSVMLDTENYRAKRKETLENLARNLAKKAKNTKRNVVLEPMNPYERRIIHSALQNDKGITTYSQGEEPYRNVVISPK